VTPKLHSWPTFLQALILVASLRLRLQHNVTCNKLNVQIIGLCSNHDANKMLCIISLTSFATSSFP